MCAKVTRDPNQHFIVNDHNYINLIRIINLFVIFFIYENS